MGLLSVIGAEGKILVLTDGSKDNVHLSARNLPNVETRPFGQESAYDILWASVVVIEKTALDSAEPSEADCEATSSRGRGEPEVRGRERDAIAEQAERRKAHRGHSKTAKPAAPKAEAAEKKAAHPQSEQPAESEATPEVAEAPAAEAAAALEAEAPAADGGSDVGSVKPPKIGELADFLAQIDSAATVKALQASDARKTAQAHYDARLTELEGGNEAQEGDDA